MKKLLLTGLAVMAFASLAQAETNVCVRPYISAKANYGKMNMDTKLLENAEKEKIKSKDWLWSGSAAVGVKMCAFRTEFEYNQTFGSAKDSQLVDEDTPIKRKQTYRSYMLNGYFDIPTRTAIRPYVGAGVGLARVKNHLMVDNGDPEENIMISKRKTKVAYQLMAGVGYNITRNWTLDIGYRWVNNGKSKVALQPEPGSTQGNSDVVKFNSKEHQLTMGLRYTF